MDMIKNESAAKLLKQSGNEKYLKSQFIEALVNYNKALCLAESDGLKSQLFGNRSAVYFEVKRYSLCIENIQLAKKFGNQQVKLQEREAKCKELLQVEGDVKEEDQMAAEFFKLSYEKHPKIPFIIDGIDVKYSRKYGHHLITNRDLNAGDIIAIEPFLCNLVALDIQNCYERCSLCLRHNFYSLIPSNANCKQMFCSESCEHEHEVRYKDTGEKYTSDLDERLIIDLSIRIMALSMAEKNEQMYGLLFGNSKKFTVFDVDDLSPKNVVSIVLTMQTSKYFPKQMLSVDTNAATSTITEQVSEKFLNIPFTNGIEIFEKHWSSDHKKRRIGKAICAFGSLFNHSCYPNIGMITLDNKIVYYVNYPIKAGEQLFISKGPTNWFQNRAGRLDVLRRADIKCDCVACKNDYPLFKNTKMLDEEFQKTVPLSDSINSFKKNCELINNIHHDHPNDGRKVQAIVQNIIHMMLITKIRL